MGAPKLEEMLDAPTGERIGYARVSTDDQNLDLQVRALERVQCLRIFTEKLSATKKRRPELDEAIKNLRPGDTFIVWRLDRLARGLPELMARLAQIEAKGAGFMSLTERFDFSTATGKLILNILGTVADFERNLTVERTKAGLAAARARGAKLGGEMKMTPERILEGETGWTYRPPYEEGLGIANLQDYWAKRRKLTDDPRGSGKSAREGARKAKMPEAMARPIWFDPTIPSNAEAIEKMNSDPRYRGRWTYSTAAHKFKASGRPPGQRPKPAKPDPV